MGRGGDMEAAVRKYLPKDEQIVMAVVGTYAGLFGLFKLKSAFSAKPPVPTPVAAAPAPVTGGADLKWGFEPPTLDNFDAWGENADNWKKWEDFMSGPLLDKWAESLE